MPRGAKPGERRGGRAKGTPNVATKDVRAAVALIAQNNVGNVQGWLNRTAKKQPARAMQLFMDLIEYHIPKLSRAELAGPDGNKLEVHVVRYTLAEPVGPEKLPAPPVEGA